MRVSVNYTDDSPTLLYHLVLTYLHTEEPKYLFWNNVTEWRHEKISRDLGALKLILFELSESLTLT